MQSARRLVLVLAALAACWITSAPSLALPQDGATEAAEEAAREAVDATEQGVEAVTEAVDEATEGWQAKVDSVMGTVNGHIASVFFFPIPLPGTKGAIDPTTGEPAITQIPFIGAETDNAVVPFAVLWLILGAIYFTIRTGLPQLRAVGHAIQVVRGKYDNPDDQGDVTSFQALSAALSATVGLGNIAGVAVAVGIGGPGATFWMICAGFLGMASKFTECTLGQMYRQTRPDGTVMGGAMYYLSNGLAERGLGGLGKVLAVVFAILCIGGSLAGGNSFQVSQSMGAVGLTMPFLAENGWIYGAIMTVAAGVVIIGGIRRIADVASKIVPTMCAVYVIAALVIILKHAGEIPAAFGLIIDGAFNADAAYGGAIGVLIVGFKRAAFSNEAGVGSAAIAHSAAKTPYAVREGIVALLEPMIDTIIVCTMTALVIVITGAYDRSVPEFEQYISGDNGAALTSLAFKQEISWFPWILSIAVMLFAFSTMISWSYYGERCWTWLFGERSSMVYKVIFLSFTFLGSIITATQLLAFGDLMILGMAIPNVLGVFFLAGKVRGAFDEYWAKLKAGEMPTYK